MIEKEERKVVASWVEFHCKMKSYGDVFRNTRLHTVEHGKDGKFYVFLSR